MARNNKAKSWIGGACVLFTTAVIGLVGCSGDSDSTQGSVTGDGDNSRGGTSSGLNIVLGRAGDGNDGAAGSNANIVDMGVGSCTILPGSSECTGTAYEGEGIPLDIHIVFDQSGSMCTCVDPQKATNPCPDPECNKTRLDAIREATEAFLRDPLSAGIGVGIGYFGSQSIGQTSCNESDYETAAVTIDGLPDHAPAVVESLSSIQPTGETPTGPAITGGCSYAKEWKAAHPSHKVVMLLITDGEPKAPVTCGDGSGPCCPTLEDAARAASDCREGDYPIDTYVLGVGPLLDNLAQIAEAGGTERAYLVSEGDVSRQVLTALNAIRGDATIPCQLAIPEPPQGQQLDYQRVNIIHADPVCNGTVFSYVETQSRCGDSAGWYYDNPTAPTSIELCPRSCEQVSVPGSDLLLSLGCETFTQIQ